MQQVDRDKLLQILGTDELVKAFVEMGIEAQNVILKSTFKKAGQIILDEATSNLGGKYRGLANSLSTSFNFGEQATRVGPFNRKGGYLAYIVDQGTKERSYVDSKTSKKHETGRITPNYWWQRANQSSQNKVEETIYQDLRKSFIEILEKNN